MDFGFHGKRHQVVVGGMVLDHVDAAAIAVEGPEFWNIAVRLARLGLDRLIADDGTEPAGPRLSPTGTFPVQRLGKRRVGVIGIVTGQHRRCISDLVAVTLLRRYR